MISMNCPSCDAKLKAPDDAVGKKTKCPKCGAAVTVPEPIYDAEVIPEAIDPYGLDEPAPPPLSSSAAVGGEARRPCPMCGEMILVSAPKCRFCGEIFDPTLKKAESKKRGSSSAADEDMSTGDWVVAILCSTIGCIAGLIWMIQGKPKGKKMLLVSIISGIVLSIIQVAIRSSMQQNLP